METILSVVAACVMAHCSPGLTDESGQPAPQQVSRAWDVRYRQGSGTGLGCVVENELVACSLRYAGWLGSTLDKSSTLTFDMLADAAASAPLILDEGVVFADSSRIILVEKNLSSRSPVVLQEVNHQYGTPISFIPSDNGFLVANTSLGYIIALRRSDWQIFATKVSDSFTNTAAVVDGNAYATAFEGDTGYLYKVSIGEAPAVVHRTALAGQSYASPLVVGGFSYTDGGGRIYAIDNSAGSILWDQPALGAVRASFVHDGDGFWLFELPNSRVRKLQYSDGAELDDFDLASMVNDPAIRPNSVATITSDGILVFGMKGARRTWLGAVDPVSDTMLWQYRGIDTAGQPVIAPDGTVIVGRRNGGPIALR